MSSAEIAVGTYRNLEPEDIRVLSAIELDMSRHEYVPKTDLISMTGLSPKELDYRLSRLNKLGLLYSRSVPYIGYVLNNAGYDCLAINALVKAGILESFGKPLGIGKEADVYDGMSQSGERIAIKFHRLGRVSFRKTKRLRGYIGDRGHISWLYQSRLAAEREYEALTILYPRGVSVPKPISHNRHVVVMGFIEGRELNEVADLTKPEKTLGEILINIRKAYVEAQVIHADLSEFNIIIGPEEKVLIIDWPQFVKTDHPNAESLLRRDLKNVLNFFWKRYRIKMDIDKVLNYVKSDQSDQDYSYLNH